MRNFIGSGLFAAAILSLATPTLAQTATPTPTPTPTLTPVIEKQQDRTEVLAKGAADKKQDSTDYQANVKKYHETRTAAWAKKEKLANANKAKRHAGYVERMEDGHEKQNRTVATPRR